MTQDKIIQGPLVPVKLWKTQSGEIFTNEALARYRARKDGDNDPHSGGYPLGPTPFGLGYVRESDGAVFIIEEVTRLGDERARKDIAADRKYLESLP